MKLLLEGARKMIILPLVGIGLTPLYPWILWKARNSLIFEERLFSAEDTIQKAIAEAKSWQGAKLLQPSTPQKQNRGSQAEPHRDAASVFSDASWLANSLLCGIGWIIKDPQNNMIHQGSSSRPYVSSALVVEALAMKNAIIASIALDVSRLTCFSDCQELVLLLNSGGHANELDGNHHRYHGS